MMTRPSLAAAIMAAWLVGCGSPEGQGPMSTGGSSAGGSGGSTGTGGSGGTAASVNPLGRARCTPPQGMTGTPQTIEDAVALVNALPKPTGVPCFVESLDRPLGAYATNSTLSLQPAQGNASPRVFLKVGGMWLSIVIDGSGNDLIEFGELAQDSLRSVKGELKLPVSDAVAPTLPFDRVLYSGGGTTCGLCHGQESLDHMEGTSDIFSSIAFRPDPSTRVKLDYLRDQASSCDWQAQPDRCDLLSALFGGGAVQDAEFSSAMATFLTSALP